MNQKIDTRQRETINALLLFLRKKLLHLTPLKPENYLNLGCSDGSFTVKIAQILGARYIYGVDLIDELFKVAEDRGIKTAYVNLNTDKLLFHDGEFDVVSAFEVIAFLWNTDNMISEAYRVLKVGGLFILMTPNSASWINRVLLLLGYLPVFCEGSLKYGLEKRPLQSIQVSSRQISLFMFKTLKRLLEIHGFKVLYSTSYSMGHGEKNLAVKLLNRLLSIRKTLGTGMFFVTVKE
jgi:ubiquinone/menaquinone biosynthesis C-methylase UbiE